MSENLTKKSVGTRYENLTKKSVGTRYKKLEDILNSEERIHRTWGVRFFENLESIYHLEIIYHSYMYNKPIYPNNRPIYSEVKPIGAKITENDETTFVRFDEDNNSTLLTGSYDTNRKIIYKMREFVKLNSKNDRLHSIGFDSKILKLEEINGLTVPRSLKYVKEQVTIEFGLDDTRELKKTNYIDNRSHDNTIKAGISIDEKTLSKDITRIIYLYRQFRL